MNRKPTAKSLTVPWKPAGGYPWPVRDLDDGWAEEWCRICKLWFSIPAGMQSAPCPYCQLEAFALFVCGLHCFSVPLPFLSSVFEGVRSMRMAESKFGAPAGFNYLGKFLGLLPLVPKPGEKPRMGQDGKPMGPAVEWQFEITSDPEHDGEFVGKIVGRITSPDPTTKNACGTLLAGLVGKDILQLLHSKEDVEPGDYVGFTYQLNIAPNKADPNKTYVVAIKRQVGGTPPPAPRAGAPAPPAPPPPRPAASPASPPPPPAAPAEPLYWISDGKRTDEKPQAAAKLREDYRHDPATLGKWQVCQVGSTTWEPLASSKIVEGLAVATAPPAPPFSS